MKFTADFETSTPEWLEIDNYARVWAWALYEINTEKENFIFGNTIETFIDTLINMKENLILYFHNLKFDSSYIFSWLLNNGYTWIKNKKEKKDKTFTCLISKEGQFYSIEIYFKVRKNGTHKVTIYDSLKILNFSVEKIAKDFNLDFGKLELDYKTYREVGHELTEHEVDYIKNDVKIMAYALKSMFDKGLTKMTIGSNALSNYKDLIKSFDMYFPVVPFEVDQILRQSYKGGWTYLNPIYKEKDIGEGLVLDVNSMYPWAMFYNPLPIGRPVFFNGKYEDDKAYPLYIQCLSCSFKIKENKLPTIQLKHSRFFMPNEYITSSENAEGGIVTLTLTSVDLKLFFEQYDVDENSIVWEGGFKFKSMTGLFCSYINNWKNEKDKAKEEHNGANYSIAKVMLNSLYGKFGKNPKNTMRFPYLDDNGVVRYGMCEEEISDPIYVPVASFITSYARDNIIRTSQAIRDYTLEKYNEDYYIYSDTDSIHLKNIDIEELKDIINVDDYKLGFYKKESVFERARFIRQKCYIEVDYDGVVHSTIAGMPKHLSKYVTFDNFKIGFSILANNKEIENKKLSFKHVRGGVVLADVDFTIKG